MWRSTLLSEIRHETLSKDPQTPTLDPEKKYMKKLIGRRDTPLTEDERTALMLVEAVCLPPQARTAPIRFLDLYCNECRHPIRITMAEEVSTGEIWAEGTDNCPNCNARISSDNTNTPMLSQQQIGQLFGGGRKIKD